MKKVVLFLFICCSLAFGNLDPNAYPANKEGCLSCHQGIEPIKDYDSAMAQQIYAMGSAFGDPNGCIICHGGNPNETKDKKIAHGKSVEGATLEYFTPAPGLFA